MKMKNVIRNFGYLLFVVFLAAFTMGAEDCDGGSKQETLDAQKVNNQQEHFRKIYPLRHYDYSRELDIYQQIYDVRTLVSVTTHSVWRGNTSVIEGDCVSIGYSIPYDVQLTNPLKAMSNSHGWGIIEQSEPNGLWSSKTTQATWVPCANEDGTLSPIYVESKVTTYPYLVDIDYETNRVTKQKDAEITVKIRPKEVE
jgi:hypothetical protein